MASEHDTASTGVGSSNGTIAPRPYATSATRGRRERGQGAGATRETGSDRTAPAVARPYANTTTQRRRAIQTERGLKDSSRERALEKGERDHVSVSARDGSSITCDKSCGTRATTSSMAGDATHNIKQEQRKAEASPTSSTNNERDAQVNGDGRGWNPLYAMAGSVLPQWAVNTLPSFLQAKIFAALQDSLRADLLELLLALPPTGLYVQPYCTTLPTSRCASIEACTASRAIRNGCVHSFRVFCRHVLNVIQDTPRSRCLAALDERLRSLARENDNVRWLVTEACGMQLEEGLRFLKVQRFVEQLSAGEKYRQYEMKVNRSTKRPEEDEGVIRQIREGKRKKRLAQEQRGEWWSSLGEDEQRAVMDQIDRDVESQIEELMRERSKARELATMEAGRILREDLDTDAEYLLWRRVHRVWESSGLRAMEQEYAELDRSIGSVRMTRGSGFESRARVVFDMLYEELRTLCSQLCGGVSEHRIELDYTTSAWWVDASKSHDVGELDMFIVGFRTDRAGGTCVCDGGAECMSCNGEVRSSPSFVPSGKRASRAAISVCVVEFKASCYELAYAQRQHLPKLHDHNLDIRVGKRKSNSSVLFRSQPSDCSNAMHGAALKVVTLIPEHGYQLGAEPKLVTSIIQSLLGDSFDIEDDDHMTQLMRDMQRKHDLSTSPEEQLLLSPSDVVVLK